MTTRTVTSSDPIGFRGGSNLYAYVANAPVNYIDPNGLAKICQACGNLGVSITVNGDPNPGLVIVQPNQEYTVELRAKFRNGKDKLTGITYKPEYCEIRYELQSLRPINDEGNLLKNAWTSPNQWLEDRKQGINSELRYGHRTGSPYAATTAENYYEGDWYNGIDHPAILSAGKQEITYRLYVIDIKNGGFEVGDDAYVVFQKNYE